MKSIFYILLSFLSFKSFSQSIENFDFDGYKYIYIFPLTYPDGKIDKYGLRSSAYKFFSNNNFLILPDSVQFHPQESLENPCLTIKMAINHNTASNVVSMNLKFADCNKKANTIDVECKGCDVSKALEKALNKINIENHTFQISKSDKYSFPEVEKTNENEISLKEYYKNNKVDQLEGIYNLLKGKDINYYKIGIKKYGDLYKAIVLESDLNIWKEGEVKAVFEKTGYENTFSTTFYNMFKNKTHILSNLENSILSLTLSEDNTVKFVKVFPILISETDKSKLTVKNPFKVKTIKLRRERSGVFTIDCKVNGEKMNFIFDTGASSVSISLYEAHQLLKLNLISEEDILSKSYYRTANGSIEEGVDINIKEIEIDGLILYNVKANVVMNLEAPLLLGNTLLEKLGKIQIDYKNNTLTIIKE